MDIFFFDKTDSGDAYAGQADTIYDFGSEGPSFISGTAPCSENTFLAQQTLEIFETIEFQVFS